MARRFWRTPGLGEVPMWFTRGRRWHKAEAALVPGVKHFPGTGTGQGRAMILTWGRLAGSMARLWAAAAQPFCGTARAGADGPRAESGPEP